MKQGLRLLIAGCVLTAACTDDPAPTPTSDAAADTPADVASDVQSDARPDVTLDATLDATVDARSDVASDVRPDTSMDAPADVSSTPVRLQILQLSDWHGQIDPLSASRATSDGGTASQPIGGAAALSEYFRRDRVMNPNTLTITGGDEFGASPPLASFFDEEPAVRALNLLGVQYSTLGNHNFDRGITHLQTMIGLARYRYVSSNLDNVSTALMNVRAPYVIETIGGLRLGIVGITNDDAASLTTPGRLGTITVRPTIASAMAAQAMARAAGAQTVIALCHLGATGRDSMMNPTGPLIDFARGVSGFAAILGDHTDVVVNTTINSQLVVESRSKGLTYSRVQLAIDPSTGATREARADIVDPWVSDVTPDAAVTTAMQSFRDRLRAQLDGTIGTTSALLERGMNVERLREMPIGDLIADAIRARYGAQIAVVNGGGIRAPIPSTYAPADMTLRRTGTGYRMGPPYDIVAGDVYEVLPFGNVVTTRTVTGRLLHQIMERSVSMLPAAFGGFLQVSGIRVVYSTSRPSGMRIRSIALNDGTPVMANDTTYTLATSDFTNSGGDGYTMLADGMGSSRELMAAVVLDYIRMRGGVMPATDGRLTDMP